jgi:hypothetical protein
MEEAENKVGGFEFEQAQLDDLSRLAEAFVDEELDAELLNEVDRDYLEGLVDSAKLESHAEDGSVEYEAAIEIAELILDFMDAADQ